MSKQDDQTDGFPFSKKGSSISGSEAARMVHPVELAEAQNSNDVYNMSHRSRGVAIIVNNDTFDPKLDMGDRPGSALDRDKLESTFQLLGFDDIRVYNNMEYRKMIRLFEDISEEDFGDRDCFVCALLSHGKQDVIYGVDGEVELTKLFSPLQGHLSPTLAGKPKVFILQACRGTKLDKGVIVSDSGESSRSAQRNYRIATESDFLMAYSVVPGYYSWRNQRNGSWFIQTFCDVMRREGKSLDLVRCLTRVNKLVSYTFQSNAATTEMTEKKQSPCIVSMLTKELYFSS